MSAPMIARCPASAIGIRPARLAIIAVAAPPIASNGTISEGGISAGGGQFGAMVQRKP